MSGAIVAAKQRLCSVRLVRLRVRFVNALCKYLLLQTIDRRPVLLTSSNVSAVVTPQVTATSGWPASTIALAISCRPSKVQLGHVDNTISIYYYTILQPTTISTANYSCYTYYAYYFCYPNI